MPRTLLLALFLSLLAGCLSTVRAALLSLLSVEARAFLNFINACTRLTAVLNKLSRAMGLIDFYPFVLSRSVVAKLWLSYISFIR